MSALVYGPIFHGQSRLSFYQACDLARLVAARGGIIVHLAAEPRHIQARLEARQQDSVWDLGLIKRIQEEYEHILVQLGVYVRVLRYRT